MKIIIIIKIFNIILAFVLIFMKYFLNNNNNIFVINKIKKNKLINF